LPRHGLSPCRYRAFAGALIRGGRRDGSLDEGLRLGGCEPWLDAYGVSKLEAEQGLREIALQTGMEGVAAQAGFHATHRARRTRRGSELSKLRKSLPRRCNHANHRGRA